MLHRLQKWGNSDSQIHSAVSAQQQVQVSLINLIHIYIYILFSCVVSFNLLHIFIGIMHCNLLILIHPFT